MALVLIRTVILYFLVLLTFRVMGKSELSEMSPFQLVIVFMIAELAAIPIESTSASLLNGIAAIVALMFLQTLLSTIAIKCEWFKNFINGRPSILIEKGEINEKELRDLRITLNDLQEQLRIKDIYSFADVEFAIMESNGELSVIPKAGKRNVTVSDMGIKENEVFLPVVVISDGTLYDRNLLKLNTSEEALKSILRRYNLHSYKDVFLAFTDDEKHLHIYVSDDKENKAKEIAVCEIL